MVHSAYRYNFIIIYCHDRLYIILYIVLEYDNQGYSVSFARIFHVDFVSWLSIWASLPAVEDWQYEFNVQKV